MNTYYQPGQPYRPGSPQQVPALAGSVPTAAVPQVDYHHPYPTYQPDHRAWSHPMSQAVSSAMPGLVQPHESASYPLTRYQPAVWAPDFSQPYQPPTWTTAEVGRPRGRIPMAAVFVGLALLLMAGAVAVIVAVGRTATASPAAPQQPSAPGAATSSVPTSSAPSAPRPFPAQPGVHAGEHTGSQPSTTISPPAEPTTAPAEPTTAPTEPTTAPTEPTTDPNSATGPGRKEAERTADGFVDALRRSDFDRAASYICSAQAAMFAAGAPALADQIQLTTLEVSDVRVTGTRAIMTMSYEPIGEADPVTETLWMTVE
jgi:hypothetical protein